MKDCKIIIIKELKHLRKLHDREMKIAIKRNDIDLQRYSMAMKQAYGHCIDLIRRQ